MNQPMHSVMSSPKTHPCTVSIYRSDLDVMQYWDTQSFGIIVFCTLFLHTPTTPSLKSLYTTWGGLQILSTSFAACNKGQARFCLPANAKHYSEGEEKKQINPWQQKTGCMYSWGGLQRSHTRWISDITKHRSWSEILEHAPPYVCYTLLAGAAKVCKCFAQFHRWIPSSCAWVHLWTHKQRNLFNWWLLFRQSYLTCCLNRLGAQTLINFMMLRWNPAKSIQTRHQTQSE